MTGPAGNGSFFDANYLTCSSSSVMGSIQALSRLCELSGVPEAFRERADLLLPPREPSQVTCLCRPEAA
jgi:hypothetical protein